MTLRGRDWRVKRALRVVRALLVGVLVPALVAPVPALGGPASFGTVRGGPGGSETSFDGGKKWLPLKGRPLPVVEGAQIRTTTGIVSMDFADGSRVNVLPFSTIRFQPRTASRPGGSPAPGRSGAAAGIPFDIALAYGRLSFRLPQTSQIGIVTPTARLDPVRAQTMVGEVFADRNGVTGVKMSQGSLQVRELAGAQRTMVATREPVFVPERPAAQGPLFSSDVPSIPPEGVRPVFNPQGESVGYLTQNGQLVVQPGYATDLTQPFATGTVQQGVAKIPEAARAGALALFDVNGGYVGYVAGPVFYTTAMAAPAAGIAAPAASVAAAPAAAGAAAPVGGAGAGGAAGAASSGIPTYLYVVGGLVLVGGGVGIAAAAGAFEGKATPATPITP